MVGAEELRPVLPPALRHELRLSLYRATAARDPNARQRKFLLDNRNERIDARWSRCGNGLSPLLNCVLMMHAVHRMSPERRMATGRRMSTVRTVHVIGPDRLGRD
jgi:hypothetical protein